MEERKKAKQMTIYVVEYKALDVLYDMIVSGDVIKEDRK
jgi:hypothetical protein